MKFSSIYLSLFVFLLSSVSFALQGVKYSVTTSVEDLQEEIQVLMEGNPFVTIGSMSPWDSTFSYPAITFQPKDEKGHRSISGYCRKGPLLKQRQKSVDAAKVRVHNAEEGNKRPSPQDEKILGAEIDLQYAQVLQFLICETRVGTKLSCERLQNFGRQPVRSSQSSLREITRNFVHGASENSMIHKVRPEHTVNHLLLIDRLFKYASAVCVPASEDAGSIVYAEPTDSGWGYNSAR